MMMRGGFDLQSPLSEKGKKMADICRECADPAGTGQTIEAPALPGGGEGGTSDFNALDNRPKYDGVRMTGNTNIPDLTDDIERIEGDIDDIQALIPELATPENQLADKDFVNSSVATNTANFVGTYDSLEELEAVENPSNNDYGFVVSTDEYGNTVYNRYKYVASLESWEFEYALNNSSFTAAQWATINSGLTSGDVTKVRSLVEIISIGTGLQLDANGNLTAKLYNETGDNTDAPMNQKAASDAIDAVYGHARVLTEADYNIKSGTWSESDPTTFDAVALWLMPSGLYTLTDSNLPVYIDRNNRVLNVPSGGLAMLVLNADHNNKIILISSGTGRMYVCYTSFMGYGNEVRSNLDSRTVLTRYEIEDSLTSSDNEKTLSAKQGKVLNERIGDLSTLQTTDKTDTVSAINEVLGKTAKILTTADYNYPVGSSTPSSVAIWLLEPGIYSSSVDNLNITLSSGSTSIMNNKGRTFVVGKGGDGSVTYLDMLQFGKCFIRATTSSGQALSGSPFTIITSTDLMQSTGTSTTNAMSQKAVTSMVFQDPNLRKRPQIGDGASATGNAAISVGTSSSATKEVAIGIGYNSHATAKGAVAIGANSSATSVGEMNIGSSNTEHGYNSSNYRLLTGLYDPQSDHDAATKGYVDTAVAGASAETISSQDWSDLWQ